jgi:hypothetical protein
VVARPLNFAVRLRVSQQAASTSSSARPLIVVWVLAVVPVCVLCGYTMLYYVDPSIPTRQEYLEGAMMGAVWAVPAALIIGITGWRKRALLRTWHKRKTVCAGGAHRQR